jgi:hypothetical protein
MVMKRILILSVVFGALIASSIFLFNNSNDDKTLAIEDQGFIINKYNTPAGEVANEVNWTRPEKNNKNEQGIKYAAIYLSKLRANTNGVYNPMDYYRARRTLESRNPATAKKASALNLDWQFVGPNNIGGRTRGFLIDNNNPNKLYSGGVTGGLFISEDLGESWEAHPQTSEWDFLGISSIKQASNGNIYFGTGEYFVQTLGNGSGHIGGGIYKSTDGGETFQVIPSTIPNPNDDNDDWSYVTEIAIDPNNPDKIFATRATGNRAFAGAGGGIVISLDGGANWSDPIFNSGTGANKEALDVAVNENGVVLLCQNREFYRSTDGGLTFDRRAGVGGFPEFGVDRIEFAFAPQDPDYVYALIAHPNSNTQGVYKSTDAGETWSPISPENSQTFNPLGEQGFYDMCITVSSADKEKVFVGGQLEFYAGKSGGWNLVASSFRSGTVFPYYIHADMHGIYSHPTNPDILFVASDGGIFRSNNATNQFPTFEDANKNYRTTQFYTVQSDDLGRVIGGAQDNGVQLVDGQRNSLAASEDLPGFGDGGYSAISDINRDAMFGQSQFGALRRSSNGGESFGSFYDANVDRENNNNTNDPTPDGLPDVGTEFIAMGYLWEDNPDDISYEIDDNSTPWVDTFVTESQKKSIFFLGARNNLYFTPEALNFSSQPMWFEIRTSGTVTEIDGTPDGTIFAGTSNGSLYQIDGIVDKYKYDTIMVERLTQVQVNGVDSTVAVIDKTIKLVPDFPVNVPSSTPNQQDEWRWPNSSSYNGITRTEIGNSLPSRYISALGVDPNFASTGNIVVGYPGYDRSSYVYKSTGTGGFNFTDITNDLILSPVYDALIDAGNPDNIVLATDLGIFTSNDGGLSWTEDNNGLYRTPVFKIYQNKLYEDGCDVIYAGTYGRGFFRTTTLTPASCDTDPFKGLNVSVEEISVVDNIAASLKLYPNPATDKVIIEIENGDFENEAVLSLVDLSGKVMFQERVYDGLVNRKHEIDVSSLSSGYYILNITDGKETMSRKFMVQ